MLTKVNSEPKTNNPFPLSSICNDFSGVNTRIAHVTFQKNRGYFLGISLMILEYIQLLSQILLIRYPPSDNSFLSPDQTSIFQRTVQLAGLFNPGNWILMYKSQMSTLIILIFATMCSVLKYLLFIYIIIAAYFDLKIHSQVIRIWKLIYLSQTRFLYFLVTSLWVAIIIDLQASPENYVENLFGTGSMTNFTFFALLIGSEFVFSLFLELRYNCLLPTKNFCASKDNHTEMFTLLEKLIIQIMQMTLDSNSFKTNCLLTSFNLLFSLIRIGHFFQVLPCYNIKALQLQRTLLMIIFSLNLACLAELLIKFLNYPTGVNFFIFAWMILAILLLKGSNQYLTNKFWEILFGNKNKSPELLIHRIIIINFIRKINQNPSPSSSNSTFSHLINSTIHSNLDRILYLDTKGSKFIDINSKQYRNQVFLRYLENLLVQFPKNRFIKLYFAYFCAKKAQLYAATIKMISHFNLFARSNRFAINASVLMYEMENSMRVRKQNNRNEIDLLAYVNNISQIAQLKELMSNHIKNQISFYEEILGENCDLQKIIEHGQNVKNKKIETTHKINKVLDLIQDFHLEPLLTCAHYFRTLNFSLDDYLHYKKKYELKMKRYHKYFQEGNLVQENIYEPNNIFILLSAQWNEFCKIICCTKSIEKFLGGHTNLYTGMSVSDLLTPSFAALLESLYKAFIDKGDDSEDIGVCIRGYACHRDGYMLEADFYLNVHPHMTKGLYFVLIVRPIVTSADALLILENGDIECATKTISRKLNLPFLLNTNYNQRINIKQISEELYRVSEAFNIMTLFKGSNKDHIEETFINANISKTSKITNNIEQLSLNSEITKYIGREKIFSEEPTELYSLLSPKGKKVVMKVIDKNGKWVSNDNKNSLTFQCMIEPPSKSLFLRKVMVLKILKPNKIEDVELEHIKSHREDLDSFVTEDEKQDKWINFSNLKKVKIFKKLSPANENETVFSGSPRVCNTGDVPLLSFRLDQSKLIAKTSSHEMKKGLSDISKLTTLTQRSMFTSREPKNINPDLGESLEIRDILNDLNLPKLHVQVSTAYKTALAKKYYPKKLKVLCFLAYMLLLMIFMSQYNFKLALSQSVSDLATIKQIVSASEFRNYLLGHIQYTTRLIWEIASGGIGLNDLGDFKKPLEKFKEDLKDHFEDLADTNEHLTIRLNFLDQESRSDFFKEDVQVFDYYFDNLDQSSIFLNNFQATQRLVETGLRGMDTIISNVTMSQNDIFYILRNSLNDLLVKNEAISDTFMGSLTEKGDDIDYNIKGYLIATTVTLGALTIIFIMFMINQYQSEKKNLIAVVKLDQTRLTKILNEIISFREVLENEVSLLLKKKDSDKTPRETNRPLLSKTIASRHSKICNHKRLKRKYYLFIAKLLCFVTILIVSVALLVMTGRNTIQSFQFCQAQLYFSQKLRSKFGILGAVSQELIFGNGTTFINNNPTPIEFQNSIKELSNMKSLISTIYLKEDDTYDPEIEIVLFINGCTNLKDEENGQIFCENLKADSINTDTFNLIAMLESLLAQRKDSFETSDKSTFSLKNLGIQNLEIISKLIYVLISQANFIALDIESDLEINLEESNGVENKIFLGFTAFLIVIGFLFWFCFLNELREINNKFKDVLQGFPDHLILSDFVLKSYLIKSSPGILDFVKPNEIA